MCGKKIQRTLQKAIAAFRNFSLTSPSCRLHQARVLLLPPGRPPEVFDLTGDSAPVSLPEIRLCRCPWLVWHQLLCHWTETNQILVPRVARSGIHSTRSHRFGIRHSPAGLAYSKHASAVLGMDRKGFPQCRSIWRV